VDSIGERLYLFWLAQEHTELTFWLPIGQNPEVRETGVLTTRGSANATAGRARLPRHRMCYVDVVRASAAVERGLRVWTGPGGR